MIRLKRHGDSWESGQIQIFAMQWLMGLPLQKYVKEACLILKWKFHTGLLGIELITNFVYQINNNHWATGWLLTWHNNNFKHFEQLETNFKTLKSENND